MTEESKPIDLSEMIRSLRSELQAAQAEGATSDLKLLVDEAEIEFKVVVTRSGEVSGGVKFWVYNAAAKGSISDATTQTIRLKMRPVSGKDLEPVPLAGEE
jgi:hypothetical protein